MKLPGFVRQIGKRVVKATPILRRHFFSSTDYRVLGGADEARSWPPLQVDGLRSALQHGRNEPIRT